MSQTAHRMRPNAVNAVLGGFVGTAVMTLMMYVVAPMMLDKPMDVAAMFGGMLGGSWTRGMLMHFAIGTVVFPLIYAHLLFRDLPGQPWLKGTIWGLILWFLSQAIVTPLMGGGLFSAEAGGLMAVAASLLAHAVYGSLLGGIAGAAKPSIGR